MQGPGSDEDTRNILNLARDHLPAEPMAADFGCGTGRSTRALAKALPGATIAAIDAVPAFLKILVAKAVQEGSAQRIRAIDGDMLAPPFDPASLDLIWSEGAAYAVGFETALRKWRPLLKDQAICVVSECEWLSSIRPTEADTFWRIAYPTMGDRIQNTARAKSAGFEVLATRPLSAHAWEDYYEPLASAIRSSPAEMLGAPFLSSVTNEMRIRKLYYTSYDYVFYVLRAS